MTWIKGYFDEAAPLREGASSVSMARQLAQHTTRRMLEQARAAGYMVVLVPSAAAKERTGRIKRRRKESTGAGFGNGANGAYRNR